MRTTNVMRIEAWLIAKLAEITSMPVKEIAADREWAHFGLSSQEADSFKGELERWLEMALPPNILHGHTTLRSVAEKCAVRSSASYDAVSASDPAAVCDAIAVVGMACRFPGRIILVSFGAYCALARLRFPPFLRAGGMWKRSTIASRARPER